jgi:hypothetical protein
MDGGVADTACYYQAISWRGAGGGSSRRRAEASAFSLSTAARSDAFAASATRAFRNQAADLRLIGRELGARYILEGNVRRIGPNLRVTAQVVEAESKGRRACV